MDRVMLLCLQTRGCAAEVRLNDFSVCRVARGSKKVFLPVHEYVLAGMNSITMVIDPVESHLASRRPEPKIAGGNVSASLRMFLCHAGQLAGGQQSRVLAELDWAAADGDVYRAPLVVSSEVSLPIKFPRWRWLDAPEISDIETAKPLVAEFLQNLVVDLAAGNVDSFLAASRLRLDELALAYQRPVADLVVQLRSRIQLMHAQKTLKMIMPAQDEIRLIPCANDRLVDCVAATGGPALRTTPGPEGASASWPTRIAVVNGQCLILR
jgi:hypothetical protein